MKAVGIIAEYNPLHTGHLFHMQEARRLSGADGVIVVMSGSFVQRGEPALVDKYRRARMALAAGADLVLELPPAAALGSAQRFAEGAVNSLLATGTVSHLAFGAETADISLLTQAAELTQTDAWQDALRECLRKGTAYPAAAAEASAVLCGGQRGAAAPNNTLAIEYLKALRKAGSSMVPVAVARRGEGYGSLHIGGDYISAAAVREQLLSGSDAWKPYVPQEMHALLDYAMTADDFSFPLAAKLLRMGRDEMTEYEDVSDDLAGRIAAAAPYACSFTELAAGIQTRSFSLARIRRALLHILLDMKKQPEGPSVTCLKVLGLREGSPLLKEVKKKASVPLITKTADAAPGLADSFRLTADLYNLAVLHRWNIKLPDDYRKGPERYSAPCGMTDPVIK